MQLVKTMWFNNYLTHNFFGIYKIKYLNNTVKNLNNKTQLITSQRVIPYTIAAHLWILHRALFLTVGYLSNLSSRQLPGKQIPPPIQLL